MEKTSYAEYLQRIENHEIDNAIETLKRIQIEKEKMKNKEKKA